SSPPCLRRNELSLQCRARHQVGGRNLAGAGQYRARRAADRHPAQPLLTDDCIKIRKDPASPSVGEHKFNQALGPLASRISSPRSKYLADGNIMTLSTPRISPNTASVIFQQRRQLHSGESPATAGTLCWMLCCSILNVSSIASA